MLPSIVDPLAVFKVLRQSQHWRFARESLRYHSRANQGQIGEAIHVLFFRCPANAAEDEDAKERIVEGPGVMAGDARDDAALMALQSPEFGARRVVFDGSAENVEAACVTAHVPVGFIREVECWE